MIFVYFPNGQFKNSINIQNDLDIFTMYAVVLLYYYTIQCIHHNKKIIISMIYIYFIFILKRILDLSGLGSTIRTIVEQFLFTFNLLCVQYMHLS